MPAAGRTVKGLGRGRPAFPLRGVSGVGAPARPMGRVGLAGRVSGAPGGTRAGGLAGRSLGGFGPEAVALGRAARGREVSGWCPEPSAPSDSRRTPAPATLCFPLRPAATFLYLPRVTGPRTLPLFFSSSFSVCLFPSPLDPRTFFSPLCWSCFEKVSQPQDPGSQTHVTRGPAHLHRSQAQVVEKRSCFLPGPQNSISLKDEGFTWTGERRRDSGVTSVLVLSKRCFHSGDQTASIFKASPLVQTICYEQQMEDG